MVSRCLLLLLIFASTHVLTTSARTNSLLDAFDLLPTELRLGDPCRSSLECLHHLHHSHCDWDLRICTCQPYHVRFNDSWCLPASLLGYGCAMDAQCEIKVPNSRCANGLCQCRPNYIPLRKDKCLPPAKVGDYCLNDRQCHLASEYSYCKYIVPRVYGKCHCPIGFLLALNDQCLPHLGSFCKASEDCEAVTPNSLCEGLGGSLTECVCRPGFRASGNGLRCERDLDIQASHAHSNVAPVSLGKQCLTSSQCQMRDPYSDCVDGICECLVHTSRCNSGHTGCLNDTFQCTSGQCISWYFVCDGERNCIDGSDESVCVPFSCPKESFQCNDGTCMSRSVVCNGRWECPDGSDEARCYTGIPCDSHSFRCSNGQCLPLYSFCNAVIDCFDGSDENYEACENGEQCPENGFRCSNNRCRSTAILCSGLDGCGDNSDEVDCEVCSKVSSEGSTYPCCFPQINSGQCYSSWPTVRQHFLNREWNSTMENGSYSLENYVA